MATLRDPLFAPNTVSLDEMRQLQDADKGSLRGGWEAGRIGSDINALGAEEASLRAAGDTLRADSLRQQIGALQQEQARVAPTVGRLEDIHGLGDAASWAAGQVGQGAASMVEPLAAATALGGAGRLASMLPGTAGKVGGLIGSVGAPLAAFGIIQRQLKGEFYNDAVRDPELMARTSAKDLNDTANLYGVGAGALDTALPAIVGRQLTGAGLRAGLKGMGTVPKIGLEMLGEGTTEALQSYGSQQAQGVLNPNRDTSGDFMDNVNAGLGGAVGAGPFTAAGVAADHGYRRVGHTADQIGAKAGDVIDMAKESYDGSALESAVNKGVAKGRGWIGAGKNKTIDLMEQAKDEDGQINLGKALDLTAQAAENKAREFVGGGKIKVSDDEFALLTNDDSSAPNEVLNGPPEAMDQWILSRDAERTQAVYDRLGALQDENPALAALTQRIEAGDRAAVEEGAKYIIDNADRAALDERATRAGLFRAVAGKAAGMAGKLGVKAGKALWSAGKDVVAGAKDEFRKKNAQGEDAGGYADWLERTKFQSGPVRGATREQQIADTEVGRRLYKEWRDGVPRKDDPEARERSYRRAELFGEILAAQAAEATDARMLPASRAEPETRQFFLQDLGYALADLAESWGAQTGPTQKGSPSRAAGTRQVKNLGVNLDHIANSIRVEFGAQAQSKVEELRALSDPGAAPLFDYLNEQIIAGNTAAGRKAMAQRRVQAANELMMLIPTDQAERMRKHAGGSKDYRMQLLEALEDMANGHGNPELRKGLIKAVGVDTLQAMIGVVNGVSIDTGARKEANMFGGASAGKGAETGPKSSDDLDGRESSDFEQRNAEKNISRAGGARMYGFARTPGIRGGQAEGRADPFAPTDKLTAKERLEREDENRQRVANGEAPLSTLNGSRRPPLFKKGERLFGKGDVKGSGNYTGPDAIQARIEAMEKELGVTDESGSMDVRAERAIDEMKRLGYQPGKIVSLYRDYLLQDGEREKGAYVGQIMRHMIEPKSTDKKFRAQYDEAAAKVVEDAEAYFKERYLVVAEDTSDPVPDKISVGEIIPMVNKAKDGMTRIEGAAYKAAVSKGFAKDSEEHQSILREMMSDANFVVFTKAGKGEDGSREVPIYAGQLVDWGRRQRETYEKVVDEEENFGNADKDEQYRDDLMRGVAAVLDSGYVKNVSPFMRDKFGKVERFSDGVPKSLVLATTSQYARDKQREERAEKNMRAYGPPKPGSDVSSEQYQDEVAREQDKGEWFVAGQDQDAAGVDPYLVWGSTANAMRVAGKQTGDGRTLRASVAESSDRRDNNAKTTDDEKTPLDFRSKRKEGEVADEFDDALYRTKFGGRSAYGPLPFEVRISAAKKAQERSGPIVRALLGIDGPGSQERGLNMIVQRIKAGDTPYKKDGPAGGVQYLYPAAAALKGNVVEGLANDSTNIDDFGEHLSMLRGQIARSLRDMGAQEKDKLAIMKLLAPAGTEGKITGENVDSLIAQAIKRTGADSAESLGYFPEPALDGKVKDITKKPLTPLTRQDGKSEGVRGKGSDPAFPGDLARTPNKVINEDGSSRTVSQEFVDRQTAKSKMRSASATDTIGALVEQAKAKKPNAIAEAVARKNAASEVAAAPKSQPKPGGGFKLTPRGPFTPKDQLKADKATAFIGRGSVGSSTNSYANDARAAGIPVNAGKYTAQDVVFVSAEGNRAGRLDPDLKEISRAMAAGATIITDPSNSAAMKRDHNVGERAVKAHLEANGYVETAPGRWAATKADWSDRGARKLSAMSTEIHNDLQRGGFAATHDSPIRHEGKFNWREHTGKGEGNAAFGAGTYLSTGEKVHAFYKKMMSQKAEYDAVVTVDGREFPTPWNDTSGYRSMRDAEKAVMHILHSQQELRGQALLEAAAEDVAWQARNVLDETVDDLSYHDIPAKVMKEIEAAAGHSRDSATGELFTGGDVDTAALLRIAEANNLPSLTQAVHGFERVSSVQAEIRRMDPARFKIKNAGPSPTYHVSVGIMKAQLLNWDKSLDEQSSYVKKRLEGVKRQMAEFVAADLEGGAYDARLAYAAEKMSGAPGKSIYGFLTERLGSQAAASDYLQSLGILGHEYAASNGRDGKTPNYVIYDDSKITTNYVHFNAQDETMAGWKSGPTAKAQGIPSTDAEVAQAKAYFAKVLHPKFKVMFEQLTGHSGEFIEAQNLIKVSLSAAAGIMPTAYHEAFHAFFAQYAKGNPQVLDVMKALTDNPKTLARLQALLHGFPAAQAQLVDGEERMAYIYQFWASGKLEIGPGKPRNWLQKLAKFFRGVLGTLRDDERAVALLEAFHEGKLAGEPTEAQKAIDKIVTPNSWPIKARRNFDGLIQQVGRLTMPAQDILGKSPSNTAKQLMRAFYASPGNEEAGMDGEGFLNAKYTETKRQKNRLAKAIEGLSDMELKEVTSLLQRGVDPSVDDAIPYDPVRNAVALIREQLDDFHKYLTDKGLEIGHIKDYFPVVWDTERLTANRAEFVNMLVTNYKDRLEAGVRGTDLTATEAAERLATMVIDRQVFDGKLAPRRDDGVLIPFFESANNRSLDWIAPEHREPFLDKRLISTMSKYFSQGVRAAEYTERFGDDGSKLEAMLKRIDQELYAEGQKRFKRGEFDSEKAAADWAMRQYRDIRDSVGAMEGTLGKDVSDTRRKFNSWATVYQNVRLLPLSLFSSVVDPLALVARGGDFKLAGEAFVNGMKEVLRTWKETLTGLPDERKKTEWEDLAEMVGATESALFAHHVSEEYSSEYMSPRAKKINDMMFKLNGMEAWNRGMRVAATKGAVLFIQKHKGLPSEHSARWLKELGLKADDITLDADGKLITDKFLLTKAKGISMEEAEAQNRKMLFAINRWVEGAVLTPNSAQRPAWSSDPNWSFMFHLKQFTYSFHQTILKRAWNEVHHGNLAPMGALAWFIPAMIASDMTKGLIVGGGELPAYMKGRDAADWVIQGAQRGGLTGYGQIATDAVADPFSLLGPMSEQVADAVRDPIGKTLVRALPANALYRGALE